MNPHPLETRVRRADAALLGLLLLLSYLLDDSRFFYGALLVSGLSELGLWLWGRKHLQTWNRYRYCGDTN